MTMLTRLFFTYVNIVVFVERSFLFRSLRPFCTVSTRKTRHISSSPFASSRRRPALSLRPIEHTIIFSVKFSLFPSEPTIYQALIPFFTPLRVSITSLVLSSDSHLLVFFAAMAYFMLPLVLKAYPFAIFPFLSPHVLVLDFFPLSIPLHVPPHFLVFLPDADLLSIFVIHSDHLAFITTIQRQFAIFVTPKYFDFSSFDLSLFPIFANHGFVH